MQQIEENVEKGVWTLGAPCGTVLKVPLHRWGSPNVVVNGNQIPSSKIWKLIAEHMSERKRLPREMLIDEAKRAEIYRQLHGRIIVATDSPQEDDEELGEGIYLRKERQRVRPLVAELDLLMAKVDGRMEASRLERLIKFIEIDFGLHPVAMADGRLMFSKDPESIFELFGSRDWLRIMVYLRRPGSSSSNLDLRNL